jgi:RimJ/RimL family protein N-acetyltransferase
MKHDIRLEGFAYSARPVELSDAEFIVEVRTPERSRYMREIDRSVQAQREWIARYFERPDEYYFVIERKGTQTREALSCLLTPSLKDRSIEWGRFITRPGSRSGIESAIFMHWVAFDILDFDRIWGDLLVDNAKVLAYSKSILHEPGERIQLSMNGRVVEAVRCGITRERWRIVEKQLTDKARQIADDLNRPEPIS